MENSIGKWTMNCRMDMTGNETVFAFDLNLVLFAVLLHVCVSSDIFIGPENSSRVKLVLNGEDDTD